MWYLWDIMPAVVMFYLISYKFSNIFIMWIYSKERFLWSSFYINLSQWQTRITNDIYIYISIASISNKYLISSYLILFRTLLDLITNLVAIDLYHQWLREWLVFRASPSRYLNQWRPIVNHTSLDEITWYSEESILKTGRHKKMSSAIFTISLFS